MCSEGTKLPPLQLKFGALLNFGVGSRVAKGGVGRT